MLFKSDITCRKTGHVRERTGYRLRAGFSLIEALVAMMILSVGIVGLVGGMSLSSQASSRGKRQSAALALAQNRLAYEVAGISDDSMSKADDESLYKVEVAREAVGEGLERIAVTVEWMSKGSPENLVLSQIVLLPSEDE